MFFVHRTLPVGRQDQKKQRKLYAAFIFILFTHAGAAKFESFAVFDTIALYMQDIVGDNKVLSSTIGVIDC